MKSNTKLHNYCITYIMTTEIRNFTRGKVVKATNMLEAVNQMHKEFSNIEIIGAIKNS